MGKYDLISMDHLNGDNFGGICTFLFVPKEWIDVFPPVSALLNEASAEITLLPDYDWLVGQCLRDAQEFKEDQQRSEAGTYFSQKLSGVVNKDRSEMNSLMDALRFRECVVIYKDRNQVRKLIGNKVKAMNFAFNLATGTEVKDKTAFYFEFTNESNFPAVHYPF